jgi:hypothetical protein
LGGTQKKKVKRFFFFEIMSQPTTTQQDRLAFLVKANGDIKTFTVDECKTLKIRDVKNWLGQEVTLVQFVFGKSASFIVDEEGHYRDATPNPTALAMYAALNPEAELPMQGFVGNVFICSNHSFECGHRPLALRKTKTKAAVELLKANLESAWGLGPPIDNSGENAIRDVNGRVETQLSEEAEAVFRPSGTAFRRAGLRCAATSAPWRR